MSDQFAFELPETLPEDLPALEKLRDDAVAELEKIAPADGEAPSQDVLDEMKRLDEAITAIEGKIADVTEAEKARADEAAAITARFTKTDDETDDEPEDDGEGDEFAADTDADGGTAEDADEGKDGDDGEQVTASASRRRTRFAGAAKAAGRSPETPRRTEPEFGYRLNGAVRDYRPGVVDSLELAKAMGNMVEGRAPRSMTSGSKVSAQFGYLERPIPRDRMVTDEYNAVEVLDAATDERNLPGGSLVAAGGWCAPSETVYDFLGTEAAGDLLSLPEIGVKRGGIKFPVEPDFSAIYTDHPGFHLTEAQVQAGTEKTCTEIPCGEFAELRLDVIGQCITNGILSDKAWPELTRKYIDEIMKAHQHRLSAFRIGKIVEGSTAVALPAGLGASGTLLNAVALAATDIRIKHRIPSGTTLQGAAPVWMRELVRADMAYQQGKDVKDVSDQEIADWFVKRGISFQFIVDWQDDKLGGKTAATAWPGEVKFALWPAGTWYSALEPVINLGVTYDSALLKVNKRTELFTEDGIAVGKRGNDSRVYTVPVAVNGHVGLRADIAAASAAG